MSHSEPKLCEAEAGNIICVYFYVWEVLLQYIFVYISSCRNVYIIQLLIYIYIYILYYHFCICLYHVQCRATNVGTATSGIPMRPHGLMVPSVRGLVIASFGQRCGPGLLETPKRNIAP